MIIKTEPVDLPDVIDRLLESRGARRPQRRRTRPEAVVQRQDDDDNDDGPQVEQDDDDKEYGDNYQSSDSDDSQNNYSGRSDRLIEQIIATTTTTTRTNEGNAGATANNATAADITTAALSPSPPPTPPAPPSSPPLSSSNNSTEAQIEPDNNYVGHDDNDNVDGDNVSLHDSHRRSGSHQLGRDRSSASKITDQQLEHLSILIKTIEEGNFSEFKQLVEEGRESKKNLLNVFVDGQTALHYSLLYGRSLKWCEQLILNGANPNLTNRAGWHPIHLAAFSGSRETMLYLIDCIPS